MIPTPDEYSVKFMITLIVGAGSLLLLIRQLSARWKIALGNFSVAATEAAYWVITSVEGRRRWSREEKERLVAAFLAGILRLGYGLRDLSKIVSPNHNNIQSGRMG
jgi:hypothetical protein